jgi:hypothetical protein
MESGKEMTLRESVTTILTYLQAHTLFAGINIDFGKFGEMPCVLPALLLYVEPEEGVASQHGSAVRKAKLRIFACAGGELNPVLSAIAAIELCEKVECALSSEQNQVCLEMNEQPPQFDDYYPDFAAAYIDFHIVYDSTLE